MTRPRAQSGIEGEAPQHERTIKKKRLTAEQIIRVLRESEAGAKTSKLSRKQGISEATFYKWKAEFGGMTVPDPRCLKKLETKNGKFKRLLARSELDKAALKDLLSQKWQAHGSNARWWTCCARSVIRALPAQVGWKGSPGCYMSTVAADRLRRGWWHAFGRWPSRTAATGTVGSTYWCAVRSSW